MIETCIKHSSSGIISSVLSKIFFFAVLFLIFILPLKFGMPAGCPDISVLPESIIMWIVSFWPPILFSLLSAVLLIFWIFTSTAAFEYNNHAALVPLLFTILAFCSLSGFSKSTCLDFPIQECLYIFGLATFAIVSFLVIIQREFYIILILRAITISALLVVCYGIYQYILGFDSTREYVVEAVSKNNIFLPDGANVRLNENFVFSTFAISNSFAAHIVLTAPVCIYMLIHSNFPKSKNLRYIFAIAAILIMTIALLLSGSRGAILSFALAFFIVVAMLNMPKKALLFLLLAILIAVITIIILVPKDFGSIFIRLDYLLTGIVLLKNNVLTGAGWGEFFHSYTYMKKILTSEAPHDPHNFIISIGAQAGIAAMITAVLTILLPILLTLKKLKKLRPKKQFLTLELYILLGLTSWWIHCLMDINFQIPGTTAIAIVLCIVMTKNNSSFRVQKKKTIICKLTFLLIALAVMMFGLYRIRGEYYFGKLSNICYSQFCLKNSNKVDIEETEKLLALTTRFCPYSPFPWAIFGDIASKNNMKELAEPCFINAIKLSPRRANFYYSLAMLQFNNGQIGYAIKNMEIASQLFPFKYLPFYKKIKESYCKSL